MVATDIKSLDYDPKLAQALGDMLIAWAYAESILTGTLARVCGIDINMAIMGYYRIPTFESRTKYISALIEEWHPKSFSKTDIADEVARIAKLAAARNYWVHGLWCRDDPGTDTIIFNFRRSETGDRSKPIKDADVSNHNKALIERAESLAKLIDYRSLTDHNRPGPSQ